MQTMYVLNIYHKARFNNARMVQKKQELSHISRTIWLCNVSVCEWHDIKNGISGVGIGVIWQTTIVKLNYNLLHTVTLTQILMHAAHDDNTNKCNRLLLNIKCVYSEDVRMRLNCATCFKMVMSIRWTVDRVYRLLCMSSCTLLCIASQNARAKALFN